MLALCLALLAGPLVWCIVMIAVLQRHVRRTEAEVAEIRTLRWSLDAKVAPLRHQPDTGPARESRNLD